MIQTQSGTIQVGDGKLYYEVAGEGPALVLTHAGFVDSGQWDGQWDAFAQDYRVIRYDMRGYGKSDPVKGPVSRREDLHGLLTHLGVEQAHILGCSLGGTTSIDFALDYPAMVLSLIAVSATPGGFQMQGDPPAELLDMMAAAQRGDLDRTSELQIRLWVDGPFRQPEQVNAQVRQRAAQMNRIPVERGTWAADAKPLDPLDPPAVGRLSDIHVPTLVIAGALDNPELLRAADVLAAGIAGARKLIIADTAHVPNMEKPAEFNSAVLDFLHGLA